MKHSMRIRLIVIFSGMLIITIACICLANLFLLPNFYQRTKAAQMKRVYAQAVKILEEHREDVDKVVAYLLEKETITGGEMVQTVSAAAEEAHNKAWTEFRAACGA